MTVTTRAKFRVLEVSQSIHGSRVQLEPVMTGNKENEAFYKWTPSGKIELALLNPGVASKFTPGKEFYVDFTEAEPEQKK